MSPEPYYRPGCRRQFWMPSTVAGYPPYRATCNGTIWLCPDCHQAEARQSNDPAPETPDG